MEKTKLGEYYDNISNVVAPKSEFVRAIAQECNVNEMTVTRVDKRAGTLPVKTDTLKF